MANISSSTGLPATSVSGRLAQTHSTTVGGNGVVVGTVPSDKLWTDVIVYVTNRSGASAGVEVAVLDSNLASNVADEDWLTGTITMQSAGSGTSLALTFPTIAAGESVLVRTDTSGVSCAVFGNQVDR